MKRIALIPLDDRPINASDPMWLGNMAGYTLLVPPRPLLGKGKQPGKPEAMLSWLANKLPKVDACIVSSDMICYGGLVHSRTLATREAEATHRLIALCQLLRQYPNLICYFFSIILRLSVSVWQSQDQAIWEALFHYAREPQAKKRASFAKNIPKETLAAYLRVRKRNAILQQQLIRAVASLPNVHKLLFCQEDAAKTGLHIKEQAVLKNIVRKQQRSKQTHFLYGADEVGAMLTSLAIYHLEAKQLKEKRPSIQLKTKYYPHGIETTIPRYEGTPLKAAVHAHAKVWAPWLRPTPLHPTSPRVKVPLKTLHLFVYGKSVYRKDPQPDLFLGETVPHEKAFSKAQTTKLLRAFEIASQQNPTHPILLLADVAYANGGDTKLFHLLMKQSQLKYLTAYAGWNTTGNTLGTVLAIGMLAHLPQFRHDIALRYLVKRILEDIWYQGIARSQLHAYLDSIHVDRFKLRGEKPSIEAWLQRNLNIFYRELRRQLATQSILLPKQPPSIHLPWGRTFEAEIHMNSHDKLRHAKTR